jgi:hypothetical protein
MDDGVVMLPADPLGVLVVDLPALSLPVVSGWLEAGVLEVAAEATADDVGPVLSLSVESGGR